MLRFTKMNGAGNDFVLFDNRDGSLALGPGEITRLCDRHRGVGADGLLLVEPAVGDADFRMRYYNSDGGEAEMCGNGARCFARFAARLAGKSGPIRFETPAGVIRATPEGDLVRLEMSRPRDLSLNAEIEVDGRSQTIHSVNTGVPHAVILVDDLEAVDVARQGAAIRHHLHFAPKGTNVNFLQVLAPDRASIRTFERGVEAETLACGTGVVAGAIVFHEITGAPLPVHVEVRGGDTLVVSLQKHGTGFSEVTLTGPGDFVFEGKIAVWDPA